VDILTPTGTVSLNFMSEVITSEEASSLSGISSRQLTRDEKDGWAPSKIDNPPGYVRWEIQDFRRARALKNVKKRILDMRSRIQAMKNNANFSKQHLLLVEQFYSEAYECLSNQAKSYVNMRKNESNFRFLGPYKRYTRSPSAPSLYDSDSLDLKVTRAIEAMELKGEFARLAHIADGTGALGSHR
jgi:hypothetical protein